MNKKYEYSDTTQLSPHFNAKEFRCKCGKEHEFSISDELIEKLEQLYAALNCSKIIVTSGFRCSAHDKAVKGSGTGQHTLGNAADICCYGQDGQPISSKVVCCKAQDIGFTGIANITAAYQYTHVDVRPNGKWYGDEVHGNNTVTDDFYKYFGGEDMKGIDVSVHNGNIDWNRVKSAGIDFAILRAGYGRLASQKDERFEQNYAGAKAVGLPIGAYWYSYAMTPEEAELEADVFLSVIKGKQFEMPVYFDLEEKKQFDLGKEQVSAIMRAFLKKVESAGYFVGLYGSASSLTTHTADDIKSRYTIWLAHKQIKNDTTEVPSYYIENHHAAIISRKQFQRCKQIRAMRRTPHPDMPGKYNNQYPLGDKLVCPICGSRLFKRSIKIQRPGSGWSCEIGEHACRQFIIRASFVEQALLNAYHTLDTGVVEKKLDSPKFGSEAAIMLEYKRDHPRLKKVDFWWVDDLVDHIEFGKHIRTTKELIALEVKGTPDPDDRSMKVFWKCGLVTTVPSAVFYDSDLPGRVAKRYHDQQKRNAEKNKANKGKGRDKK